MDYVFDAGRGVRVIVLDTVRRDVGSGGVVSAAQAQWLCARSSPPPATRRVIVVSHQPLTSVDGGQAALALLDADRHVVAALAGDTHHNRVVARHTATGGYWLVQTASLADYPQQARVLRVRAARGRRHGARDVDARHRARPASRTPRASSPISTRRAGGPQREAGTAKRPQRAALFALARVDVAPYSGPLHMSVTGRDPRVLVVEDDEEIAQVLQRSLRLEGYEVRVAGDGEAALDQSAAFNPDLVILDLGLPKLDGMEVARRLRSADDVPILMLTARDALEARVEGLDAGADDYLVKPFERQELLARLRALLRRRPPRGSASVVVGDLALNPDTHEVSRGEREIELTQREFELLEYLMRNERIVVPRQRLLEEVWGYDPFATTNTIEVFVSNLRRKLEAGGEARLLHTIRGAGYVLRA